MLTPFLRTLSCLGALALPLVSAFAAEECKPAATPQAIVFGNGILNTWDDALDSLQLVMNYGKEMGKPVQDVDFYLAFNFSAGAMADLADSVVEKIDDLSYRRYWRWVMNLETASDSFEELRKEVMLAVLTHGSPLDQTAKDHIALYKTLLHGGYKIVLISHSQGNFYANIAYDQLRAGPYAAALKSSFQNMSVATPAAAVASGGPHWTFSDDMVITAVRLATLGAVMPDTDDGGLGPPPEGDILGHNFMFAYMRHEKVGIEIIDRTFEALKTLSPPVNAAALPLESTSTVGIDLALTLDPGGTLSLKAQSCFQHVPRGNITGGEAVWTCVWSRNGTKDSPDDFRITLMQAATPVAGTSFNGFGALVTYTADRCKYGFNNTMHPELTLVEVTKWDQKTYKVELNVQATLTNNGSLMGSGVDAFKLMKLNGSGVNGYIAAGID